MKVWEKHQKLCRAVRKTHREHGEQFHGHDFDHVVRVANYCHLIAPDEDTGMLAAIAAMCHNADRILQILENKASHENVEDVKVIELVDTWLDAEGDVFSAVEREVVVNAVLKHANKNEPNEHIVTVVLIDSDRLVNTELDVVMRHAQLLPRTQRIDPIYLLKSPGESFSTPKSLLGNTLLVREEWLEQEVVQMRIPKARKILRVLLYELYFFSNRVVKQRKDVGLVPWPESLAALEQEE